jgi:hypothetical protein
MLLLMQAASGAAVAIVEVLTVHGRSKWIVTVNGRPVANYWTKSGADKKVASVIAGV